MGFHGYGHTSCIIGDCSIADCPEGPQVHYHSHDSTSYNHSHNHLHPNRTVVPRHRNDGPVDLSQYCTPTGRGTWSIGGQRAVPQASDHLQIPATSNQPVTRSQPNMAFAFCPTPHTMEHRAIFAENPSPVEQAFPCQSTPNVYIPKVTLDDDDAKNDRSNGDTDQAELGKKAAVLLNLLRAIAFPIPVCHEHCPICANTATIMDTGKASALSTSIISSQQANGGSRDIHGNDADVGTVHHTDQQVPMISNTSSSLKGSTASSREGSTGPGYEGLSRPLKFLL